MKIIMAYDTKVNGKTRKADATFNTDADTARALIYRGRARAADTQESEEDSANTEIGKDLIKHGEE